MFFTRSGHMAVLAALSISALGATACDADAQANGATSARAPAALDTTPVSVVLYQDDLIAFINPPTERLMAARTALEQNDGAAAARELRAAAAYMRVQAGYVSGTERADILEAARDVDRVSSRTLSREIRTPVALDEALRGADQALAWHHWNRARRAWKRRETERAGLELRAAANAVERAARVAGRDTESGAKDVVRGTRVVSGKLIQGAGWRDDEIGKGLTDLGRAIERLGKRVER